MKLNRGVVFVCSMLVGLAACTGSSAEAPPRTTARTSFETPPNGERVFAAYRHTGDVSQKVTLPKGTRQVLFSLDCAGTQGHLKVELTSAGGAGVDCTPRKVGRGAHVMQSGDGSLLAREQTITITGPNDQEWSVTVDAGAQVGSN